MLAGSMARPFFQSCNGLAQDLIPYQSPGSVNTPKNVVVVMDGLKEFSLEPIEWVLKNIAIEASCHITLVGVTPWLNIPLFSKTWSDVWTMHLEDFKGIKERSEWKSDVKHQKVQKLVDLCKHYGVVPQIRSESGFPMQLIAVEKIIGLHATLVVFDRHHRKYREYYAKRIPCNIVMMNGDGEVDLIKGKSSLLDHEDQNNPGESPESSAPPTPILLIPEHLKRLLLWNRSPNSQANRVLKKRRSFPRRIEIVNLSQQQQQQQKKPPFGVCLDAQKM